MIFKRRLILTQLFKFSALLALFPLLDLRTKVSAISGFSYRLIMKYDFQKQTNLHDFYNDSKSWEDKYAFLDLIDQFQKSGHLSYTTKILVENSSILRVFHFQNETAARNYISQLSDNKIINWSLLEKCGYRLQIKTA